MEEVQEILRLLRENNEMLKEIVTILRKTSGFIHPEICSTSSSIWRSQW